MTPKQLKNGLREGTIYVTSETWNPDHTIFNLHCGAQITIYHRKGTVVVRGKVKTYWQWDAIAALQQVLPVDTRWQHSFA